MFLSGNKVKASSLDWEVFMRKLNKRKVRWIIKQMLLGELSVWQIAKQQDITSRWARKLFEQFRKTGKFPFPEKPGRQAKPISFRIQKLVLQTYKRTPVCAVKMEQLFDELEKHVPHNTIHAVLKANGFARPEPKKQHRRKWVQYERRHSNSLWHIDYCEIDGKQTVAILDDASRFVVAGNEFDNATAENATKVLKQAIELYGVPQQLLSDNGTHFLSLITKNCFEPEDNIFQKTLKLYGIKHIKTRIHHPQTNGKQERWFGTIKRLKKHFGSLPKAIKAYNYDIHHLSLTNGHLRTPAQAFVEKMRQNT
jgi:putative transposase